MMPYPPTNIVNLFLDRVSRCGDSIAIIDKKNQITYTRLNHEVQLLASKFEALGIKKGDHVLVFVPMSIELYRTILALFYVGAIPVFIDQWASRARLSLATQLVKCKAFVATPKGILFSYFVSTLRAIPIKSVPHVDFRLIPKAKAAMTLSTDPAIITLSTGSTGTPKAAIRTHLMLFHQLSSLSSYVNTKGSGIDMTALPIVLLINLAYGKTSIIPDANLRKLHKLNSKKIYDQLVKYKVSSISGSPFFIEQLAKYKHANIENGDCIQQICIGGAPCYPKTANLIDKAFSGAILRIVYGSTEAEPISSTLYHDFLDNQSNRTAGLYVGSIHPAAKVKVIKYVDAPIHVHDEGEVDRLALSPYAVGEIIVQGPHVLRHYLHYKSAEDYNKICLSTSFWHRTGDSGYIDEKGHLYLTGRCKDLVYKSDAVLAPFVFEYIFSMIDGIDLGTILLINEKIIAAVEITDTKSKLDIEKQILNHCPQIDCVVFTTLPRDPRHFSKIDYIKLKSNLKFVCTLQN